MLTLATLLCLTAAPTPPPMVEAPSVVNSPRRARLVVEEDVTPSPTASLAGRVVLAPVLGLAGGAVGGVVGAGLGVLTGLVFSAGTWGSLSLGFIGAALGSLVGYALGAAVGASLFSGGGKDLLSRTLPWAFLAVGVAAVVAVVAALVFPFAAPIISVVGGLVATAAVPLIVESRRLATAPAQEDRGPAAEVPVATF